jgi:hypothetical protein
LGLVAFAQLEAPLFGDVIFVVGATVSRNVV